MEITGEHEEVDHRLWLVKDEDAGVRDGGRKTILRRHGV